MAVIRWTAEAAAWLEDIYKYIAKDNLVAARRVAKGIYDKAHLLREFPRAGYLYRNEPEGEIRVIQYGHYRIAYLLRKDGIIDILGVFHDALEIDLYI